MITAVGLSHKTAPLAVRERFAFAERAAERLLGGLVGEALLLVTCNRTELYGTAAVEDLRQALLATADAPAETPLFVLHGRGAVHHLLAVSAGLDSMILGEPQILGQVKDALATARRLGKLGAVLDRLGRQALAAGRRVRNETLLGRDRPSIPKAAAALAREAFAQSPGGTMLVIGAGKVGALTAQALWDVDAGVLLVTNRTPAAAETLARAIGGRAAEFGDLDRLLGEADIIISCTGSPRPLLDLDRVRRAMDVRAGRPLVVIDLAVPRDVAPEVRHLPGLRLFDLDDLRGRASHGISPDVVAQAEAIVEQETAEFLAWVAGRQAVPTIQALRRRAEALLEEELAAMTEADPEFLRAFGQRLLNKLLHHPLVRMRDRAATHGPVYLDVARDLFALDATDGTGERDGGA